MSPAEITHVLYHAHCLDGFGAAYAAWKRLGSAATYLPVRHGHPPPILPEGARVALVDFCYPRAELLALAARVGGLIVLDHHQSAQAETADLPFVKMDLTRAGSCLAWGFFHPGEPEPALLRYVEDRDLWRFGLPQSRELSAALAAQPMDFETWDQLQVEALCRQGRPLLARRNKQIRRRARRARLGTLGGWEVPIVSTPPELRSELAEELLRRFPEAPFAAVWFQDPQGRQAWSLRSRGDFDVSGVASALGGGGHRAASGFARAPGEWLPTPQPGEARAEPEAP